MKFLFGHLRTSFLGVNTSLRGKNALLYSTKIATTTQRNFSISELYRRISPVGDPNVSIVPILNQWVEEGRPAEKEELQSFIKELRYYKRYSHALQISMWMTDKRYIKLGRSDIAIRLDLIGKVHGLEQAENYFNYVPKHLRVLEVYGALLNCYAKAKAVEKAEALMQKMKDLGFNPTTLSYNVLLSLYYQTGNNQKFVELIKEIKENGIRFDKFTYSISLSACAAASDNQGIDKLLKEIESDPNIVLDWTVYSNVASAYTKVGILDKAMTALKKAEELVTHKRRSAAYNFILTQYAAAGKKDEVLRLWEIYKNKEKVFSRGYMCILTSLLKLDDIENAKLIFDEWQSQGLQYDIRIPNLLIGAYCRKGLMEKAENLVKTVIPSGGKPDAFTWYYLASGYLQNGESLKAVEAMKKALLVCSSRWKPDMNIVASCLNYLKEEGDVEGAKECAGLMRDKGIVSEGLHDRLLDFIKGEKSMSNPLGELSDDASTEKTELPELSDLEEGSNREEGR